MRKVVLDNLPFLLSDTVGFIRKLPTQLVESFKSTLDEVREADLLLHVVDISHPNFEEQIAVVRETLREIGAGDKPVFMVFNKVDAFRYKPKEEDDLTPATRENLSLDEIKRSWMAKGGYSVHLHLGQRAAQHRQAADRPLRYGKGNPCGTLSVQQLFVLTLPRRCSVPAGTCNTLRQTEAGTSHSRLKQNGHGTHP